NAIGSDLALLRAPDPADVGALSRLGRAVDARPARGRWRLPAQSGSARPGPLLVPDRGGGRGDGRAGELARAGPAGRGLRLGAAALGERRAGGRSRSATRFPGSARTASGRSPGATPSC